MDVVGVKTSRAARHHEAANTSVALSPHDREIGNRTVGDPHLGSVEHPVRAVASREGPHARGVAAEIRFGQAEAADALAARHRRQPLLLLRFVAPAVDGKHRQRALHRGEAAQSGVAGLQLEAGQSIGDRARAGTAVAFEMHAQQTERGRVPDRARAAAFRLRTIRQRSAARDRARRRAPYRESGAPRR